MAATAVAVDVAPVLQCTSPATIRAEVQEAPPVSSPLRGEHDATAFSDGSNGFNMRFAKNRAPPRVAGGDGLPIHLIFLTYANFVVGLFFSYTRDARRAIMKWYRSRNDETKKANNGYAPLLDPFSTFFEREMYGRIRDVFGVPVQSCPGAYIDVMDRTGDVLDTKLSLTGTFHRSLNMSSYNYLGFAETEGPLADSFIEKIEEFGISTCSPRMELGSTGTHSTIEREFASFVGKEACIIYGMGYITNASSLPSLIGPGCLVVSDSLNHASIIVGCRASGATIKVFKHNDAEHLEDCLRKAVVRGQPRTHRPWKKIVIVVEGVYSMEGEICCLPAIVELKKKYKAYLYLDEAHSIGAIGKHGRGVCEYWGIDPSEIDIMMGTFTKSFAAVGGYIAASKELIDYLRVTSVASMYDVSLPVPLCNQILNVIHMINESPEGRKRIDDLARNTAYFRKRLDELGFDVIGDDDSPVVPAMVYLPNTLPAFGRLCNKAGVAVVIVSYPATDLLLPRVRFCISAAHTIADLDAALVVIERVGDACMIRYRL